MSYFKKFLLASAQKHNSRLIFNLDISAGVIFMDLNYLEKSKIEDLKFDAISMLNEIKPYVSAIKINRQFTDVAGLCFISELLDYNIPLIADFKIADIDSTSSKIASNAFNAGFDAVICHGFVGKDPLEAVCQVARDMERGVIVVVSMSHPGSRYFINPNSEKIAELVKSMGSEKIDGVVAPATFPGEIKKLRNILGDDILIMSPGVGAQGANPGDAISHGADFEMVGRAIYNAQEPGKAAKEIAGKLKYKQN